MSIPTSIEGRRYTSFKESTDEEGQTGRVVIGPDGKRVEARSEAHLEELLCLVRDMIEELKQINFKLEVMSEVHTDKSDFE